MDSLVPMMALLITRDSVHGDAFRELTRGDKFVTDVARDLGPISMHTLICRSKGYEIQHDPNGRINTVFVHVKPWRKFKVFRGELIFGLSPGLTRKDVRKRLGKPSRIGTPGYHGVFGEYLAWDRFDAEFISVHIQYSDEELSLDKLTLMAPEVAP